MTVDLTYQLLYRVFFDETFKQSYFMDPEGTIAKAGITDAQQSEFLKNLVTIAIQRPGQSPHLMEHQEDEMKSHYTVLRNLRNGINETIEQMLNGFRTTMTMYTISFYVGILLIIASVVFTFINPNSQNGSLLAITFAGLGTAEIITYFISNPPLKLQNSRADLAQLQAAYFAWYQDLRFWSEYLAAEYWMKYQPALRSGNMEFASKASTDYRETQERVSKMIINNTKAIVGIIERFVEVKNEASERSKADTGDS